MDKRKISFVYRLLVIASLLGGIVLNMIISNNIKVLLSYYTMWSNILCLIVLCILFLLTNPIKYDDWREDVYYIAKGLVTIGILITGFIYLATLLPNGFPIYIVTDKSILGKKIGNILVHIVSPLFVIIDYFLFDKKGKFKLFYPIIWILFPITYICFVYSGKGEFFGIGGSREFAYFFLDYKLIGMKSTVCWIIEIALGILLLGYALIKIDQKLAKRQEQKKKT